MAFATEGPFFNTLGMESVVLGPGDIATAHQPDEHLPAERLASAPRVGHLSSAGYGEVKTSGKREGPAEPIREHGKTVPSGTPISTGCRLPWNRMNRRIQST